MKRLIRQAGALFLALALLSSTAFASVALGDELHTFTVPLAENARLTNQLIWSSSKSDLRTENYVTYTPSGELKPVVGYGSSVLSKQTVSAMAAQLEASGRRVLTGTNGDYFDMGTGNPLGLLMTDGIVRSSPGHLSAIGFGEDGNAIIGMPEFSIMATFAGHTLKVAEINKVRTATGYYLMNSDFGTSTKNTQAGLDVILTPVLENVGSSVSLHNGQAGVLTDALRVGGRMNFVVDSVRDSTADTTIPTGKYVLTIHQKGGDWIKETLASLKPGDKMSIDITANDPRWNTVSCAVGAMHRILTNGAVATEVDDGFSNAPRTAVGVKSDGSVLFYALDGRQSGHSIGASLAQVGQRLKELGCVNAVCLDGGGSTTMVATTADSNSSSVVNKPSDGSQRAVTNAIFLVSNRSATGSPAHVYVTPKNQVLMVGANTGFNVSFTDSSWFPVNSSESVTFSADRGNFDANGAYIAPSTPGVDTITATSTSGLTGRTMVTIFAAPNALRITNVSTGATVSSLGLSGGDSVSLKATATYQKIPMATVDNNFVWSVEPANLGTITSSGVFTAAHTSGTGSIKITSGGHSASIPLTVSSEGRYTLVENFEGSGIPNGSATATLALSHAGDRVRFGNGSLRWDYKMVDGISEFAPTLPLSNNDGYLGVWVYGDKSGATLKGICLDSGGLAYNLSFGEITFTGWKQLWAALPANPATLTTLSLAGGSKTNGSIWMDQLLTSNQYTTDTSAPKVTITINGNQLTATASDNADKNFQQSQITVTVNGKAQSFTISGQQILANLPAQGATLQQVTVAVRDQSGNIGRSSQTIAGTGSSSSPFVDMKGHWAISYTNCLSSLKIITGYEEGGKSYFYPGRAITRGDFALMTARWMGIKLEDYASVTLPFDDASKIPSWSLNAVKAMYSLGIMQGVTDKGQLLANARSNITRAEAMTILGRIQEKGYPAASLSQFKDASSVPTWANNYVATLVGQGVVSGYDDGYLRCTNSVSRAEVAKMLFTLW